MLTLWRKHMRSLLKNMHPLPSQESKSKATEKYKIWRPPSGNQICSRSDIPGRNTSPESRCSSSMRRQRDQRFMNEIRKAEDAKLQENNVPFAFEVQSCLCASLHNFFRKRIFVTIAQILACILALL